MENRVLKKGVKACFDTFSGLINCDVLSVSGREAKIRLTQSRGAYKAGEELTERTLWVVPVGALIKRQFSTSIGFYSVECDEVTE